MNIETDEEKSIVVDEDGDTVMTNDELRDSERELDQLMIDLVEAMQGGRMETEFVTAGQDRPGWKSIQAGMSGSDPASVMDLHNNNETSDTANIDLVETVHRNTAQKL